MLTKGENYKLRQKINFTYRLDLGAKVKNKGG